MGYVLTFIVYATDLVLFVRGTIVPNRNPWINPLGGDQYTGRQIFPWYELFSGSDWVFVALGIFGVFWVWLFFAVFSVIVMAIVSKLLGIKPD
jgi:hypothetical protein